MIRAAIAFFVLAIVAIVFVATGIAGLSIDIGKTLVFVLLAVNFVEYIFSLG